MESFKYLINIPFNKMNEKNTKTKDYYFSLFYFNDRNNEFSMLPRRGNFLVISEEFPSPSNVIAEMDERIRDKYNISPNITPSRKHKVASHGSLSKLVNEIINNFGGQKIFTKNPEKTGIIMYGYSRNSSKADLPYTIINSINLFCSEKE